MNERLRHYPVNWQDGMKINKDHFIAQDNAVQDSLYSVAALNISPVKYGLLPSMQGAAESFNTVISADNQQSLRVVVHTCRAITRGGIVIDIPSLHGAGLQSEDGVPAITHVLQSGATDVTYWAVLSIQPYDRMPAGEPDKNESPPRFPHTVPAYTIEVVADSQYKQYAHNPYCLTVGKVNISAGVIVVDDNYIPPCYTVASHQDLAALHSDLDKFYGALEMRCIQIVQKIFKKSQQNDLSELVLFLCDRVLLYLGTALTTLRWELYFESPVHLLSTVVNVARVMKNTIDLRTGSGKEELLNYLSEWCELNQGELENLLNNVASVRYDHNDVNKNIEQVTPFIHVVGKLFDTLSNLDFIGKRKEAGIFVKEEYTPVTDAGAQGQAGRQRRRFFG